MTHRNYNRRKFIGISLSTLLMSLAGCSRPQHTTEQNLEFKTYRNDEIIRKDPEEWENTNSYVEKSTTNGPIKLDYTIEDDKLFIYSAGPAPQSNYKYTTDKITRKGSEIIINGYIEPTESDIGLTVITEVDTVIAIESYDNASKIILNLNDGWHDEYSLETSI